MKILNGGNNRLDILFDDKNCGALWHDIFGTHLQVGSEIIGDTPKITKLEDYLYSININEFDEEYANDVLTKAFPKMGGCSQIIKDNLCGRNYDWTYDNRVTFVIRTDAINVPHSSIGVAQCRIDKATVEKGQYSNYYKLLPFQTLDGINDAGVYCATNVVPAGDKEYTTGTNPKGKLLYAICIPRYVLNSASSARHAIDLLLKCNIKSLYYDNNHIELHFIVKDSVDTYVVETVYNKLHIMSNTDDRFDAIPNNTPIITNFYLSDWNGQIKTGYRGNSEEEIKETGLTPHADGLERYEILLDGYAGVESVRDMLNLMQSVNFTLSYNPNTNPYWYSEVFVPGARNIYSPIEDFETVKDSMKQMYDNRSRDIPNTWQTVHTSVYDLENKTLTIVCQEGETEHQFTLD